MQKLSIVDCENRIFFCERFIRLHYETRMKIWFSDECFFPFNLKMNSKNTRYYAPENQHRKISVERRGKNVNVLAQSMLKEKLCMKYISENKMQKNIKKD